MLHYFRSKGSNLMKPVRGFSLVELLVVITIIGILAAIAVPNMTRMRDKAKETEVKANLHVIQEAVERYYTNENEYPAYLLGGSNTSWPIFHNRGGDPNIDDPLIKFAYLSTYPKNPFIDEDKGAFYLAQSGGSETVPASGDPRFGLKGTTMPNSVDDPMFFTTTPGNFAETINQGGTPRIMNYGTFGGMKMGSGEPTVVIIPGSFFYRSEGPIDMTTSNLSSGNPTKRDFVYSRYERYMLGGFGHDTTKGFDVIRLTGAGIYKDQPGTDFGFDVPLALPEVFGGGDNQNNPAFPYEPSIDGAPFLYGAPDGLEDGVIIVLTDSGENMQL
jgi:prepilin-type N-terminal cleavage/methylation domain-containing protein